MGDSKSVSDKVIATKGIEREPQGEAGTIPCTSNRPVNRYDRMEWAGAFGDLGTLIPFVVGYIAVLKMDPVGVLLAFGITKVAVGIIYKTPMPVQPMKAIGGAAIGQAGAITPGMVYGSGLVTAAIWHRPTGAIDKLAGLASKPRCGDRPWARFQSSGVSG